MYYNSKAIAEYLPIIVFFSIAVFIAIVVVVLPKILAKETYQKNKLKSYECGFEAFGDARGKFDIRFYLVAILFVIFDLEVAFLIPWAINLRAI